MSRSSLLLVAAALAAGGFGCAHCDTCDDFPAPCTGPNCGFQGYPIGAELPGGPIVPIPAGPSDLAPVGPPVGGPAAEPAPTTSPSIRPRREPGHARDTGPPPGLAAVPPDVAPSPGPSTLHAVSASTP